MTKTNEIKMIYTVKETAAMLGIGKEKVYELIKKGHLNAMDLGGLKVSTSELNRFIDVYTGFDFKDMDNVKPLHLS